ncbi:hypothetical protein [Galactobacter sp.]|uniref:hypothetical protein n=1 Tax=Galactobacter sp. TaxID=2676125 RepID=UPI0025C67530|nr:hypothetical protein [Galactobacter sp.]
MTELLEDPSHHWYQTTRVDESSGLINFCAHEVDAVGRERKECDGIRLRGEDRLRSLLTAGGCSSTLFSVGSKGNRPRKASGYSSSPLTARELEGLPDVGSP